MKLLVWQNIFYRLSIKKVFGVRELLIYLNSASIGKYKSNKIAIVLFLFNGVISVLGIVISKYFYVKYGVKPIDATMVRYVLAVLVMLPITIRSIVRGSFAKVTKQQWLSIVFRDGSSSSAALLWFTYAVYIPINTGTIFSFLTPILVVLLCVLFRINKVSIATLISIIAGFAGVVVTIRITNVIIDSNVIVAYIGVFVSILLRAVTSLLSRSLTADSNSLSIVNLFQINNVISLIISIFMLLLLGDIKEIIFSVPLLMSAFLSMFVYFLFYSSFMCAIKLGDIVFLQSFDFVRLIFSIFFGYIILGEMPSKNFYLGAPLVLFGCAISLFRSPNPSKKMLGVKT